ncbi:MAG: choice-of-anchor Q domain-containing protein, partial [Acidimicrobiales bacterium]
RAASGGGGIENIHPLGEPEQWGVAQIAYSTIVQNEANVIHLDPPDRRVGGGIRNTGKVFIGRSILAENSDGRDPDDALFSPDCYSIAAGDFTSYRRNVVGVVSATCLMKDLSQVGTPNDRVGSPNSPKDPRLSNFGGYFRPDSNSPAVDYGRRNGVSSWFKCQKTDNLGNRRPVDGDGNRSRRCDVGAIERPRAS